VSDVYFSTEPGFTRPGRYLIAQTMAFVMGSQELARQMVDPWRTKLTTCALPVEQGSSYDDFAWINHDKSAQPAAGQSLAPEVEIGTPELETALPAFVDHSFHRIRYQLVDKPGIVTIAPRYFDLITLSAGTSVVYLAMQSNGDPPAVAVRVAAVHSLLEKLVA
jgi:hypothetical protein